METHNLDAPASTSPNDNELPIVPPEMETTAEPEFSYRWRFETKIVAYIDLILGGLSILGMIPLSIGLTYIISTGTDQFRWNETFHELYPFLKAENWSVNLGIILAATFLSIVVAIVEIWAANRLRIAISISGEPKEVLPQARDWMRVNLVILVFSVISIFLGYFMWSVWLWLAFRATRVLIVHLHVRELLEHAEILGTKHKYVPVKHPHVTIKIIPAS